MNAISLVNDAIHDRQSWKKIGDELTALPPDTAVAQHLLTAHRNGSCEPWMTAYLLGCIGDPIGYETAFQILLSKARSSASYAAVAMTKMRGDAAYPDLHNVLMSDHLRKIRQGAVYGLEKLNLPQLLDDLLAAHRAGKIWRASASWHIAHCNPSNEWLTELLRSSELNDRALGCATVEIMVRANTPIPAPNQVVKTLIHSCLVDGDLAMMPSRRQILFDWVNQIGTGGPQSSFEQ
jgi:hypothetical protein